MENTLFPRFLAVLLVLLLCAPRVLSSTIGRPDKNSPPNFPRQEEENPNPFNRQCGTTHFCESDPELRPNCVENVHGYTICEMYFPKGDRMMQLCKDCVDTNCQLAGCEWYRGQFSAATRR